MAVFIALVFVAYIYVWKKGGLDWSLPSQTAFEAFGRRDDPDDLSLDPDRRQEVAGAR
jgi:hypothetical protein